MDARRLDDAFAFVMVVLVMLIAFVVASPEPELKRLDKPAAAMEWKP